MFKVYIDSAKMADICLEQDQDDKWYNILCHQSTIAVNCDVNGSDFLDENNPIFLFSQNNGIIFEDATTYMSDVIIDNKKVLEQPCGAFILDVDPSISDKIQKDYGVICQSTTKMDSPCVAYSAIRISHSDSKGRTWGRFPYGILIPTNSLIIQDRYFFNSDRGETINDTYDNFESILRVLLPDSFGDKFHVMVIVDGNIIQARDNVVFDDILKELNKRKKIIQTEKGYEIQLEVLSIPAKDANDKGIYKYESTHNRYIVSNYYTINALHKIKAFRGSQALSNQTLTGECLYSGLSNTFSDLPIEMYNLWVSDMKDIIAHIPGVFADFRYACDSDKSSFNLPAGGIKNRLLL